VGRKVNRSTHWISHRARKKREPTDTRSSYVWRSYPVV
jgi:hypothetical protein